VSKSLAVSFTLLLLLFQTAPAADVTLTVIDPQGAAGRIGSPVSVEVDLDQWLHEAADPARLRLQAEGETADAIPVQFEPHGPKSRQGTLRWLMPPRCRRFHLSVASDAPEAVMDARFNENLELVDVAESGRPVLQYNHGKVAAPAGVPARYARGDYISRLYGPDGELLTEDFPHDHAHHRAVGWSWPVTRFGDEVRDIWAVVGVWARPVKMQRVESGPVVAVIEAESVWKWGDTTPIVQEEVVIRAYRAVKQCRFVDVEVRLKALADRVAIGGRPHGGYGGFGVRAAPVQQQKITAHVDPADSQPRRCWLDYSGLFNGGKGTAGLTIFEHVTNPGYPNELKQYPPINYVMPAFPGDREVPLGKDKWLVLKHRLWIHPGGADAQKLADVWAAYANPPKVTVSN